LSTACFAVRSSFPIFKCRFSEDGVLIKYGVNFWGNSNNVCHLFTLQNTKIRTISGVQAKNSCRNLFKKLTILPVSFQYILYLMMFVADYQRNFQTHLYMDWIPGTRIICICFDLLCLGRGASYSAM